MSEGTGQGQELDVIDVNDLYHFKATQGIQAFPDAALGRINIILEELYLGAKILIIDAFGCQLAQHN